MTHQQLVEVLRALGVSPDEVRAAADELGGRDIKPPKAPAVRRRRHATPRPVDPGNVSSLARERARRILGR